MAQFDSVQQEEEWLQDMMSANSFVFSQEGTDLLNDQSQQQQIQDDQDDSDNNTYELNYDQNHSTPRDIEQPGDVDQKINFVRERGNNLNNNMNEEAKSSSDSDDSSTSMSDLEDEMSNRGFGNNNNNKNQNRKDIESSKSKSKSSYKYKPVAPNYWPNEIEKLTKAKWGHYAELDRFINPWTLSYIGIHQIFDETEYFPQWISYKYDTSNTAFMLLLSSIIMILACIHVSFTSFV